MHVYICIFVQMHVNICIYMHMHTYIHICFYTYILYMYIKWYPPSPYPISLPISLFSGAPGVFKVYEHSFIYYNMNARRVPGKTSKNTPKKTQKNTKEQNKQTKNKHIAKETKTPKTKTNLRTYYTVTSHIVLRFCFLCCFCGFFGCVCVFWFLGVRARWSL